MQQNLRTIKLAAVSQPLYGNRRKREEGWLSGEIPVASSGPTSSGRDGSCGHAGIRILQLGHNS